MDDTGNAKDACLGVPAHADVFLLCAGEGNVQDVSAVGVEDIDGGLESIGIIVCTTVVVGVGTSGGVVAELFGKTAHETREVKGVLTIPVTVTVVAMLMRGRRRRRTTEVMSATEAATTTSAGTTAVAMSSPASSTGAEVRARWLASLEWREIAVGVLRSDFCRIWDIHSVRRVLLVIVVRFRWSSGTITSLSWLVFIHGSRRILAVTPVSSPTWVSSLLLTIPLIPVVPRAGRAAMGWDAEAEVEGEAGTEEIWRWSGTSVHTRPVGLVGIEGVDKVPEGGVGVSWCSHGGGYDKCEDGR